MKVEGAVTRKRSSSITIHYDMMGLGGTRNPVLEAEALLGLALTATTTNTNTNTNTKKLKRLPHVFSKVLELPFNSDADVYVEECSHCFRFVVEAPDMAQVEAFTFQVHPGITKVVVRETGFPNFNLDVDDDDDDDLDEVDMWRVRLPEYTRPELAGAVLVDGELIVTVPRCSVA